MRPLRILLPLLATAGALALGTPAGGAPAAERTPNTYREYVSLGDSWTADVVVLSGDGLPATDQAPIDCAQSKRNYPRLVAAALGVPTFRDASCGSATTDDFTAPQTGLPVGGTNPAQFDRLSPSTDLVTVGIGGNDAGISSGGLDCLNLIPVANPITDTGPGLPFGGCKAKYTAGGVDQLSAQIRASRPKLVQAFKAIHRLAPHARILAIDYLAIVPDHGCYPRVPATDEDMAYINAKFLELNAMVERAAKRGGAEFVNTYGPTRGHDLCQGPRVRYGEVLGASVNSPAVGIPAHPNSAGARAQADVVLRYLLRHPNPAH
jgi:lysophospholipase L1-like esterase